nr:MAG TPA: hypothetical protein [Caudoviricetes sp.]
MRELYGKRTCKNNAIIAPLCARNKIHDSGKNYPHRGRR